MPCFYIRTSAAEPFGWRYRKTVLLALDMPPGEFRPGPVQRRRATCFRARVARKGPVVFLGTQPLTKCLGSVT